MEFGVTTAACTDGSQYQVIIKWPADPATLSFEAYAISVSRDGSVFATTVDRYMEERAKILKLEAQELWKYTTRALPRIGNPRLEQSTKIYSLSLKQPEGESDRLALNWFTKDQYEDNATAKILLGKVSLLRVADDSAAAAYIRGLPATVADACTRLINEKDSVITRLKTEVRDWTRRCMAYKEDKEKMETELFEKFVLVLNQKKEKIKAMHTELEQCKLRMNSPAKRRPVPRMGSPLVAARPSASQSILRGATRTVHFTQESQGVWGEMDDCRGMGDGMGDGDQGGGGKRRVVVKDEPVDDDDDGDGERRKRRATFKRAKR